MKLLRSWNGELRFLQNFKLVRLGKKNLIEADKDMDCSGVSANNALESDKAKCNSNLNDSAESDENMNE